MCELFDTAKNLSLYSWFVYEFHSIADLTGFLALEAALKARAVADSTLKRMRFNELMRHALQAGWLSEERIVRREELARMRVEQRKQLEAIRKAQDTDTVISIEEPTDEEIRNEDREMRIIETVCRAALKLRNALAHGERMLVPGSYARLRMMADLINQLFMPLR